MWGYVGSLVVWRVWVHKILMWVKKSVSGVGQNFGMVGVGLKRFVKKLLLKVSQSLGESTCAGVSC